MSLQIAPPTLPAQSDKKLVSNEIHLYFAYPEQISDPGVLSGYEDLLVAEERTQMLRFHFARQRHQYLVTRALIRTSLSAYYEIEPSAWRFEKNGFGKPEICKPDNKLPIRFNLSHTNGLILCGITRGHDIGVDIEDRQRSPQTSLSSLCRYFSPQEIEDLHCLPQERQKQRFFEYWTLKESYIKARGAGLSISLDKFSFHFEDNKLTGFSIYPELHDSANHWTFWSMPLAERYQVAVAIKSARQDIKICAYKSVPLQSIAPVGSNLDWPNCMMAG